MTGLGGNGCRVGGRAACRTGATLQPDVARRLFWIDAGCRWRRSFAPSRRARTNSSSLTLPTTPRARQATAVSSRALAVSSRARAASSRVGAVSLLLSAVRRDQGERSPPVVRSARVAVVPAVRLVSAVSLEQEVRPRPVAPKLLAQNPVLLEEVLDHLLLHD